MKKEQSLAGVIRERLESIEQRLAVGVRQEVFLAELAEAGYQTSLSNFRNELWRARKRKEETSGVSRKAVPPPGSRLSAGQAEKPAAAPQVSTPKEGPVPAVAAPGEVRKITNPADIRKARKREINLDDYTEEDK